MGDEEMLTTADYGNISSPVRINGQHLPNETSSHIVIIQILGFSLSLSGFIGNSITILVIVKTRSLWTAVNVFIINLCISDMVIGNVNFPIILLTIGENVHLSSTSCTAAAFILISSLIVGVQCICLVTLNRFMIIVYPNKYKQLFTKPHVVCMIMSAWFSGYAIGLLPMFQIGASYGFDSKLRY